jgi:hypothetical protein
VTPLATAPGTQPSALSAQQLRTPNGVRETPEEAWLRAQFKVSQELRLGAFAARSASSPLQASLIVRPVNLHVGLDHLVLSAPSALELSTDESRDLMQSANDWLSAEGVRFQSLQDDIWEALVPDEQAQTFAQLDAASSRMATGRNIDAWMVRGPGARSWRRLCNEIQMLWHTHPVNLRRESRGAPVINGLWLEGAFGPLAPAPVDHLFASDPAWRGLGLAAGLSANQVAAADLHDMAPILSKIAHHQRVLLISDQWHRSLLAGDSVQWLGAWSALDQLLREQSRRTGLGAIHLICTGEQSCWQLQLSSTARWLAPLRTSVRDCLEQGS